MKIKNKTGIAIITLLLLPVFFLFFLKSCGSNNYSLERLHCDSTDLCYSVDSSLIKDLLGAELSRAEIKVIYISNSKSENEVELEKIYSVVNEKVQFIAVNSNYLENSFEISKTSLHRLITVLKNETTLPIVLLDNQNHICGYYSLDTIEEINRLLIEVSVLIQE